MGTFHPLPPLSEVLPGTLAVTAYSSGIIVSCCCQCCHLGHQNSGHLHCIQSLLCHRLHYCRENQGVSAMTKIGFWVCEHHHWRWGRLKLEMPPRLEGWVFMPRCHLAHCSHRYLCNQEAAIIYTTSLGISWFSEAVGSDAATRDPGAQALHLSFLWFRLLCLLVPHLLDVQMCGILCTILWCLCVLDKDFFELWIFYLT